MKRKNKIKSTVNDLDKLRMRADIRRKGKLEKTMEFVKRIRKVQEEARVVLKSAGGDEAASR